MTETTQGIIRRFLDELGGHLVMDTDLRIVDVGPEFVRLTKTRREDIVGKLFVNIVTERNPERHRAYEEMIRAAAATATKSKITQKLDDHRLDVYDSSTGHSEERWWRSAITPIEEDGRVKYLVLRSEDVTTINRAYKMIVAQRRSNYILYVCVLLTVGVIAFALTTNSSRTSSIASETCVVQTENLQGSHLLAHIMSDIGSIIGNSPRPKQPVPPKVRFYARRLGRDINRYTVVINKEPRHRKCS